LTARQRYRPLICLPVHSWYDVFQSRKYGKRPVLVDSVLVREVVMYLTNEYMFYDLLESFY